VRPVFQAFLRDTLALWSIEAIVRDGRGACLAQLHDDSGRIVRIEPAPADLPFRWMVS
jgi:hypothetical protein